MAETKHKEHKGHQLETAEERARRGRALSPFEEMDRMLDSVMPRGWMRPFHWDWPELARGPVMHPPRVDVIERNDEVLVRAEVPGVSKDDLDISVNHNAVTIKGSTHEEDREEKGDYFRSEIHHGEFSRTVALPAEVDSDNARAKFRDGILELTMPKLERSKRRKIKVE